jgi:hypothetical protein
LKRKIHKFNYGIKKSVFLHGDFRVVVYICNPSTQEAKGGGSQIQASLVHFLSSRLAYAT